MKSNMNIIRFLFFRRDLQRGYLDVLTWLIQMESTVTTNDINPTALINDVLKKTSLLTNVGPFNSPPNFSRISFRRDCTMLIHYPIR